MKQPLRGRSLPIKLSESVFEQKLGDFLQRLALRKRVDNVGNPYCNPELLDNLKVYFQTLRQWRGVKILLIGEAPGYRGCGLTGIPFSCPRLIQESEHLFWKKLSSRLFLPDEIQKEQTAFSVWQAFPLEGSVLPVCWNSFPFHPHRKGEPKTNRAPLSMELKEGESYLLEILDLFEFQSVVAIGRKAESNCRRVFTGWDGPALRHPSYGGKAEFLKGMQDVLVRLEFSTV